MPWGKSCLSGAGARRDGRDHLEIPYDKFDRRGFIRVAIKADGATGGSTWISEGRANFNQLPRQVWRPGAGIIHPVGDPVRKVVDARIEQSVVVVLNERECHPDRQQAVFHTARVQGRRRCDLDWRRDGLETACREGRASLLE